jgi:hypothetical protein
LEIHPDQNDYNVVTKCKGGGAPHSTFRFNADESGLWIYNGGDSLTVKIIPEKGKVGLFATNLLIRTTKGG